MSFNKHTVYGIENSINPGWQIYSDVTLYGLVYTILCFKLSMGINLCCLICFSILSTYYQCYVKYYRKSILIRYLCQIYHYNNIISRRVLINIKCNCIIILEIVTIELENLAKDTEDKFKSF